MSKKDKQVSYRFLSAHDSDSNRSETEGKLQETVETENDDDDSVDSYDDDNSDFSSIILKKNERKSLRKSKIFIRQNINEIESNEAKRKLQQKMVVPQPVVEKIEKNEFELSNMIDEALHFIEGKYLVLNEKEFERVWTADNAYQNNVSKVNDALEKINSKFIEINDKWKITSNKEDKLVKHEEIGALRDQSLQLLEEKDHIIHELMQELDELSFKFINEISSNSSALNELNKVAEEKINILKDEHEKQNLVINKLFKDEEQKKFDKDSTEWTLLLNNTIDKISSTAVERLSLIKDKKIEIKKLFQNHEEEINYNLIDNLKKSIGMEADCKIIEMKCSENLKSLEYDCYVLKQRINDDVIVVADLKKRVVALQKLKIDMREKLKTVESKLVTRIPIIKKEIVDINKKIDIKGKIADEIVKKNNCHYIELWQLQQNNFIGLINEVHEIDDLIREFLGISKTPDPCQKPVEPAFWKDINLDINSELNDFIRESSPTDTYVHARDRAFNKLLMDFLLKNLSFLFEYNLNEVLDTNSIGNIQYLYNALSILKLNKNDSWNLMKSKFKPFVICSVCKTEINWEYDENMSDSFEEKKYTNAILDNCPKKIQTRKSVLEILSTHLTRHYENIEKVKQLDSLIHELNGVQSDESQNEIEKENEEHSTTLDNDETPAKNVHQCGNVNHELFIDDKHFIPILIEVIKIARPTSKGKLNTLHENLSKTYDFLQYKLSENDLRDYWSKYINVIPDTINSWDMFHQAIEKYYNVLLVRQTKLSRMKKLQNSNEEMRKILCKLKSN